ncbi:hypothetical protein NMY22_g3453 [Coprinellus aureogranulatus]|nr:hypothetical protein NMY22_g3453 [Coprinellus aureogranulatus]
MEHSTEAGNRIEQGVTEVDAAIARIRSRIAELEDEERELKRRRNALAHISDIELREINAIDAGESLFPSAQELIARQRRGVLFDRLSQPPALLLSHVCHAWRVIINSSSDCWSWIQVRDSTHPQLLDLVLRAAGEQLLHLDYTSRPHHLMQGHLPLAVVMGLRDLILARPESIKSLALYGCLTSAHIDIADFLLSGFSGSCDNLKSVVVRETFKGARDLTNIPAHVPRLRHLIVEGKVVPWKSLLLTSSRHLTHIRLINAQEATPASIAQLLSCIAEIPQLQSFGVDLPSLARSQPLDFSVIQAPHFNPVYLPALQVLMLLSYQAEPLVAILSAIRIPGTVGRSSMDGFWKS